MEAKISVTLRPFPVPVGVVVEPLPSKLATPPVPGSATPPLPVMLLVPLEQFSHDEINWLCGEFQRAVFRKAGLMAVPPLELCTPPAIPKKKAGDNPSKKKADIALTNLLALLTDQEGQVSISGVTDEEAEAIRDALETLENYLA